MACKAEALSGPTCLQHIQQQKANNTDSARQQPDVKQCISSCQMSPSTHHSLILSYYHAATLPVQQHCTVVPKIPQGCQHCWRLHAACKEGGEGPSRKLQAKKHRQGSSQTSNNMQLIISSSSFRPSTTVQSIRNVHAVNISVHEHCTVVPENPP
jgi:hypothetical protein